MAKTLRKVSVLIVALLLAIGVFAACSKDKGKPGEVEYSNKTDNHDYKVTVLDNKGKPQVGAGVQVCKETMCFLTKEVDENGVVYFDVGEDIFDTTVDELVVHVVNLPDNLTADEFRMKKGQAAVVYLKEVPVDEFEGGDGTAVYDGNRLKNDVTLNPYRAKMNSTSKSTYKFAFSDATKPVFIEFTGEGAAEIFELSINNVDITATLLSGNKTSGITKTADCTSKSGKGIALEFTHTSEVVAAGDKSYFELMLNDATYVGKDIYITFEYVDDVQEAGYPTSGKGTGDFETDILTGQKSDSKIDQASFNPYNVGVNEYKFKFTSATQMIFYAFKGDMTNTKNYKVYSKGEVNAKITRITGTAMTGLWLSNEQSDDISATDKNFSLDFYHDTPTLEMGGTSWFMLTLSDAADVNKEGVIVFETVGDYVERDPIPTVDILPAGELGKFPSYEGSNWTYVPLDGNFVYVLGKDGFYHKDTEDGAVLCASLGLAQDATPEALRPRAYDASFWAIAHSHGQSYIETDGISYRRNYLPLLDAYTENANADGRYGVTKELKSFLELFIGGTFNPTAKAFVEDYLNANEPSVLNGGELPQGCEWLFDVGYYDGEPTGTLPDVEENETPSNKNEPIDVYGESFETTVPVNEIYLYRLAIRGAGQYTIAYNGAGVEMKWLGQSPDGAGTAVEAQSGLVSYTFTGQVQSMYYFVLKNTTEADVTLTLSVTTVNEESVTVVLTEEDFVGLHEANYDRSWDFEVPFKFEPETTATYTIQPGENTTISVMSYDTSSEEQIPSMLTDDELREMNYTLEFVAGRAYTISISRSDGQSGTVSFTVALAE